MSFPVFFVHDGSFGKLVATYKPQSVIFSTQGSLLKEKETLVEACIKYNVKILLARSPKAWNQCDTSDKKTSITIQPIQIEDLLGREEIQINLPAIGQEIKDKVVLVTGAAGSIGSEFVFQIVTFEPKMILLFDIAETPLYQIDMYLKEHYPRIPVEAIIGDVRNRERLEQLFQQYHPQIVYHAAAYKHVPMMENHPSEAIITNVLGTCNVANRYFMTIPEACRLVLEASVNGENGEIYIFDMGEDPVMMVF